MDLSTAEGWGGAIYLWIIPLVLGDAVFPPVPSEMAVITGGALAAEGTVNPWLVGLVAAAASWLGDIVVFQLFKRRLSHVLDRWKWGRRVHRGIHEAIAKAGRSSTYGAIIGARFIQEDGSRRRPPPGLPTSPPVVSAFAPRSVGCCGRPGRPGSAISPVPPRSCRSGRAH